MVSLLIEGGTVVTVDEDHTVISDGAVAIDGDTIRAVGPTAEINEEFEADRTLDATGHAVIPGLISTHAHVSDLLLRGAGVNDGRDVYDWLYNVKVPGIAAMTPDEHAIAAALYCQEAIQSGVTTFVENAIGRGAGFDEAIVDAKLDTYDRAGLRSVYAQAFSDIEPDDETKKLLDRVTRREPTVDHVEPETIGTEEAIEGIKTLIEQYHGTADGRQSIWPAPYLTWGVSPDGFASAYDLAERYDIMTTTHVSETPFQERQALSSIEYLDSIGYLGNRVLLGHCVHLNERDIRLLATTDTKVAHNVLTNLALGDGVAPVPEMLRAGVTVALGTDNASASDTINAINDLRFLPLVHSGHRRDPGVISADQALAMATIDAARAIGREDELGSIKPGKLADVVLVDLDQPHLTPSDDVTSAIVYQAQGFEVNHVICNGQLIMEDRSVNGVEQSYPDLRITAQRTAETIRERVGLGAR